MYSVHQHWDPLQHCVVGMTYPPEFYSWISNVKVRESFERLAMETEEDCQALIKLLVQFDVTVSRPHIPKHFEDLRVDDTWIPPPIAPRDYFSMIGFELWMPSVPNKNYAWNHFYGRHRQPGWPDFANEHDCFSTLPPVPDMLQAWKDYCVQDQNKLDRKLKFFDDIVQDVLLQGNYVSYTPHDYINGAFVSRIGRDLYFATQTYYDDQRIIMDTVNGLFPRTRNHVVNAGGHGDSTYCPVAPGLIISLRDIPTYAETFPDWEVVYLPPSNYEHMSQFRESMKHNRGRWFIPGFDSNPDLVHHVEHYFDHWVGQVSETVFDVNILVIDHHNIVVSSYNKQVESACANRGITMHVVPFRHRYFWDCGTHCVTNDLDRRGEQQDFFPQRSQTT